MTRIAIFGGTFDPPHIGHIGMADAILSAGVADKIVFLPAYRPPHKDSFTCLTPFDDRMAMLRLAIDGKKAISCSDFESLRPEKSYTYDTLTTLSEMYPEDKLSWIIGGDSLLQLHTWYRATELVKRFRFIIFPRPGSPVTIDELCLYWSRKNAEKLSKSMIFGVPKYAISSTEVRKIIQTNGNASDLLHPSVLNYIETHHLYSK